MYPSFMNRVIVIVALVAVAALIPIYVTGRYPTQQPSSPSLGPNAPANLRSTGANEVTTPATSRIGAQRVEASAPTTIPPVVQEETSHSLPVKAPSLRSELNAMKEQLRASTSEQFKTNWNTGNYIEYQHLTRGALTDGDGNPLPNEVRSGINGGFWVVVLRPETHPEACALMLNIRSLEAEIKALESAL